MEHKGSVALILFFFLVLYSYCVVDPVKAAIMNQSSHKGQRNLCEDIVGPKWNLTKQGKSPCPTLVVWVPKKRPGFTEIVKVNEHNEVEGGFAIEVFCYAIQLLPFNVQPIFIPFVNETGQMNGTYDDLVQHIEGQRCMAVAGDVTITAKRAQHVSFTIPYLSAEVYMLVSAGQEWNQTLMTFLRPFELSLWISLICASILTGIVIAFLEYRADNRKFASPFYNQVLMAMWFPISTFFFHEGKIRNKCSKVVLVMWLCMIFIVLQIFTATLSSWLTLNQLRPKFPKDHERSGYQTGSFVKNLIIQKFSCSGKYLMALNSYEEFKKALDDGSVDAVFDIIPYVNLFIAKYGSSQYTKYGPVQQEAGIAFALPIGSELLEIFSRAVINITESDIMTELKSKYLGISTPIKTETKQYHPQSLGAQCFIGLFIFMAIVTLAAIIISEISLRQRDAKVGVEEEYYQEQATPSKQVQIKIPD